MAKQIAIYPGFFDPFTLGHLNVAERACQVFDKIIVAVAADSPKEPLFSVEDRCTMIQEVFRETPKVEVDQFHGLLVDYLRKKKASILLRGIRTVSDFEYEFQMALANKSMAEDIETLFMMTDAKYSFLSSTLIRDIARLGGDTGKMVPPLVGRRIQEKYANQ